MYRIVNEQGLTLELNASDVISSEKNNPLFNDPDTLFQDISFPGKAGLTDQNKRFFNYAHLIETPNNAYLFPVTVYAGGDVFLTGNMVASIDPDGFSFNLELNLSAVTNLISNIRITEIRTDDGNYNIPSPSAMEALMLDTCVNPDKYPYIFMPVLNDNYGQQDLKFYCINNYDTTPGIRRFRAEADPAYGYGQSAFWKLQYVLGVVANYLGFTLAGDLFSYDKYKYLYIYTRRAPADPLIYPSFAYMPNMLVADFLKQLRERLHLSLDFDLSTKILTVGSFKTICLSEPIDITPYLGNVIEQQLPAQEGLTVSIKSDEQDAEYEIDNGEEKTYPPLFKLVVGDGSKEVELECGTLKSASLPNLEGAIVPITSQTCVAFHSWSNPGGIPDDLNYTDQYDPTTLNNWPLRLIRFTGYRSGPDGYPFPFGEGVPLDADDQEYYQFLNDSKLLIITCFFPPAVLAGLKLTGRYTFRTAGYNYCDIIIQKITYDVNMNQELVPAKIYAYTINLEKVSQVSIIPVIEATPPPDDGVYSITGVFKAYFDPVLHGIDQVEIEIIADSNQSQVGQNNVLSATPGSYTIDPITISTNSQYAGGAGIPAIYIPGTLVKFTGNPFDPTETVRDNVQTVATLTVKYGNPQYILHRGLKMPFSIVNGVPTIRIDFNDSAAYMSDFYIIVF